MHVYCLSLGLHKQFLPIKTIKQIKSDLHFLHRVGIADCQSADRLGMGVELLTSATEVHIFDHVRS
jgi:hypothetical protein